MKTKKSISDDIRAAIALRAYYIWERTGRPEGRGAEHWALAEAEILSEQSTPKASTIKKAVKKAAAANPPAKKALPEKPIAEPTAAPSAAAKAKSGKTLPRQR